MDRINDIIDGDLIDLGAASVETQGGQQLFGEPDGRGLPIGIAED
jgi:hypothetical protein